MINPSRVIVSPIRSHTELYFHLAHDLRHGDIWYFLLTIPLMILSMAVVAVSFYFPSDKFEQLREATGFWVPALLFFVIVYSPLVVYIASATRDPVIITSNLAARILIYLPKPRQPQGSEFYEQGLNYAEVKHLQRIAEIEQNSAGWRGDFVNLIFIGTISIIISSLIFFSSESLLQSMRESYAIISNYVASRPLEEANTIILSTKIYVLLLAIGLTWSLIKLYNYYREFLSTESANRIILLACEEAISLLETKKLTEILEVSFTEKIAIAKHFGCDLVPRDAVTPFDRFAGVKVWDSSDKIWLLISPKEYSQSARLFYGWQQLADNLKSLLRSLRQWLELVVEKIKRK